MTRVAATKGICPLCAHPAVLHRIITDVEDEDAVPLDAGINDVACSNQQCPNFGGGSST